MAYFDDFRFGRLYMTSGSSEQWKHQGNTESREIKEARGCEVQKGNACEKGGLKMQRAQAIAAIIGAPSVSSSVSGVRER